MATIDKWQRVFELGVPNTAAEEDFEDLMKQGNHYVKDIDVEGDNSDSDTVLEKASMLVDEEFEDEKFEDEESSDQEFEEFEDKEFEEEFNALMKEADEVLGIHTRGLIELPEKRLDTDGNAYTQEEFHIYYRGLYEWNAAGAVIED